MSGRSGCTVGQDAVRCRGHDSNACWSGIRFRRHGSSTASTRIVASFGFLALHALATPYVLLGKNAGFELATPVGLVVAGAFAAASAVELSAARAAFVMRRSHTLVVGLAVPVVRAMAQQASGPVDLTIWGSVAVNLAYSNLAREIWLEAGLDQQDRARRVRSAAPDVVRAESAVRAGGERGARGDA